MVQPELSQAFRPLAWAVATPVHLQMRRPEADCYRLYSLAGCAQMFLESAVPPYYVPVTMIGATGDWELME